MFAALLEIQALIFGQKLSKMATVQNIRIVPWPMHWWFVLRCLDYQNTPGVPMTTFASTYVVRKYMSYVNIHTI